MRIKSIMPRSIYLLFAESSVIPEEVSEEDADDGIRCVRQNDFQYK